MLVRCHMSAHDMSPPLVCCKSVCFSAMEAMSPRLLSTPNGLGARPC
jgi:hypothetical protein